MISYTIDGSTPAASGGTASPVTANVSKYGNTTLKAIAYESGWTESLIALATYNLSIPLYITNYSNSTVAAYTIGSGGVLSSSISSNNAGTFPLGVAITSNGRYLYVTNFASTGGYNGLSAYAIGSGGVFTPITLSSSGSTTGPYPEGIALTPNCDYLYVANSGYTGNSNTISAFSIGSGGTLTSIGAFTTGANPQGIAITPNGSYLYVTNSGAALLTALVWQPAPAVQSNIPRRGPV